MIELIGLCCAEAHSQKDQRNTHKCTGTYKLVEPQSTMACHQPERKKN